MVLEKNFSVFKKQEIAFYLQDYYAKEWIENTMIFVEVENTDEFYTELASLNLPTKYASSKLSPIRTMDWEKSVFFMIRQAFYGILESFSIKIKS